MMRRLTATLTVLLVLTLALPALANGDRDAPPPPDATTTTTTTTPAPEPEPDPTTTTTTTTPVTPVAPPPTVVPPRTVTPAAPTTTTTTIARLPVPSADVVFVCPGYFEFTLGNSGNATAIFELSLVMAATGRTDEATIEVAPGDTVVFDGFVALAGEEDSYGEVTVHEVVTDTSMVGSLENINCAETSVPVEIIQFAASRAEDSCPPYAVSDAEERPGSLLASLGEIDPKLLLAGLLALLVAALAFRRRRQETPAVSGGVSEPRRGRHQR